MNKIDFDILIFNLINNIINKKALIDYQDPAYYIL